MKYLVGSIARKGCGCVLLALIVMACAGSALYGAVQLAQHVIITIPR